MSDKMIFFLIDILLILVIGFISHYYKKNLLRKILTYSIILYIVLSLIYTIGLLPIALIFNDTGASIFSIILKLPISACIFMSTYFVPMLIFITFIVVIKEKLRHKNNKD